MSEIDKLKKTIIDHEDRISRLEKQISLKPIKIKSEKPSKKSTYSGTSGGIQMLIDNGFLNKPKSSTEIYDEMRREGFYKSKKNVDGTLRIVFVKKKILERFKDDKIWKYVLRK